ncbi:hypothetical protein RM780_19120 [Streptomyces sp. DSM 44917]|uniref:Uncharacterized protein n=1 Tax=Streptomyces boetiae TaxID=3075541 RepID=A0ABU2LC55_9ACTN|nr:hypothetical protein [Streptomyces sp. DSM 44917]MDT0309056.1 hypothetical protein [Streptomyces sp. DSM 44917]
MAHRPSVPADLDHPRRLWARAATLAMLAAVGIDGDEYQLLGDGELRCDHAGGSYWWRLTLPQGGDARAVFRGHDADGSHGHLRRTPVDFLAGGPRWLPWEELREEQNGLTLGFVYWWQDGSWGRAPYPEDLVDDGLELSAGWVSGDGALTEQLWEAADEGENVDGALAAFLDRAQARTVDAEAVRALLASFSPAEPPKPQAVDAALEVAARAALTP